MPTPQNPPIGRAIGVVVVLFLGAAMVRAVAKDNPVVELPQDRYGKYAAFAELDNTVGKLTLGTLTVRVMRSGGGGAAEYDGAERDMAAADAYVNALEAMDLTDAERAALMTFKAGWRELVQMHEELTGSKEVSREQLLVYWKKANALDNVTNGVLEAILADQDLGVD